MSHRDPDAPDARDAADAPDSAAPASRDRRHDHTDHHGEAGAHLASERRRYPSTIGGLWYLVVLASTLVGIVIVWVRDWRVGVDWIGGALLAAAIARLLLPVRDAGMLAVRHRILDVVLLASVGLLLIVLSITIPNQPG